MKAENKIKERKAAVEPEKTEKPVINMGSFDVHKHLPFIIFVFFIGLVYIWNSNTAVKHIKKLDLLTKELRDVKSEYTTLAAELSYGTKQSMIAPVVDSLGLKKLKSPPYKLIVSERKGF